jgi:hypothetical protein
VILGRMFENNYKEINKVACNITRHKNRKLAPELINETFIEVHEKEIKGYKVPSDDLEFIKLFSKHMSNNFLFQNSGFNKAQRLDIETKENNKAYKKEWDNRNKVTEAYVTHSVKTTKIEWLSDDEALKDIEILAEGKNERTNELIDIISSMSQIKAAKYIDVIEFERSLPEVEKILFDLYFRKCLSTRGISKMYSDGSAYKINHKSINKMINNIKTKIKSYEWKS